MEVGELPFFVTSSPTTFFLLTCPFIRAVYIRSSSKNIRHQIAPQKHYDYIKSGNTAVNAN